MCGKTLHAPRVPVGVLLGVVRTCCTGSLGTVLSTGELYVASD